MRTPALYLCCPACGAVSAVDIDRQVTPPAPPRPKTLEEKVKEIWEAEPTITGRAIAERVGGRNSDIYRILRSLKGEN